MRRAAGYSKDQDNLGVADLLKALPLPNLPGHRTFDNRGAPKSKAQTLRYVRGYPIVEDSVPLPADPLSKAYNWGNGKVPGGLAHPPYALHDEAASQPRRDQANAASNPTAQAPNAGMQRTGKAPNWLLNDRKVMRFYGYAREEMTSGASWQQLEQHRIRICSIRYFLEDDSLEIVEPQQPNTGLPQGTFLRRHKVVASDGKVLQWDALRVGSPITIYQRTYHITACDPFTRTLCEQLGAAQPADMASPDDPYLTKREAERAAAEAARARARAPRAEDDDGPATSPRTHTAIFQPCQPPAHMAHLAGVKDADRERVLRFNCVWDNTKSVFGEKLAFALHYYMSDGTVEIREVHMRNSGREPFPLLLSRRKLPKTTPPVYGRPMSPKSQRALNLQYYEWSDFTIGTMLQVYGRTLQIYDCDESTRDFCRKHMTNMPPEKLRRMEVDFDMGPKRPPLYVPPHDGLGSEEDSLQNVLHLLPKPPPKPYTDYLENWNKVMRFSARLVPLKGRALVGPFDASRRFILSLFLLDKTLAVWEPRTDNSGMPGGTFLERTRVKNPTTGLPYNDTDLQVGGVIELFSRAFELLDADMATLKYVEGEAAATPARMPWAHYPSVIVKLQQALAVGAPSFGALSEALAAVEAAGDGSGYIAKEKLYGVLVEQLRCPLTRHEVITLVRTQGADRQGLLGHQLLDALGAAAPGQSAQGPGPLPHAAAAAAPGTQLPAGVVRGHAAAAAPMDVNGGGVNVAAYHPVRTHGPAQQVAGGEQGYQGAMADQRRVAWAASQPSAQPVQPQQLTHGMYAASGGTATPPHPYAQPYPQQAYPYTAQYSYPTPPMTPTSQDGSAGQQLQPHQNPPPGYMYAQSYSPLLQGQQQQQGSQQGSQQGQQQQGQQQGQQQQQQPGMAMAGPGGNAWVMAAPQYGQYPGQQLQQQNGMLHEMPAGVMGGAGGPYLGGGGGMGGGRDVDGARDTPEKRLNPAAAAAKTALFKELGKEPAGQAGNPTRDPRFIAPPGGIGYAPAAAANAAAQEMLKARASMWQSSNNAVGGIGNAASFRQEQKR